MVEAIDIITSKSIGERSTYMRLKKFFISIRVFYKDITKHYEYRTMKKIKSNEKIIKYIDLMQFHSTC